MRIKPIPALIATLMAMIGSVLATIGSVFGTMPPIIARAAGIMETTRLIIAKTDEGDAQRFLVYARIPNFFSMMARLIERSGALMAMTGRILAMRKGGL